MRCSSITHTPQTEDFTLPKSDIKIIFAFVPFQMWRSLYYVAAFCSNCGTCDCGPPAAGTLSASECCKLTSVWWSGLCISYHSRQAGNKLDRVLDVLLGHLHHRTVFLFQRQGVSASLGHPLVHLNPNTQFTSHQVMPIPKVENLKRAFLKRFWRILKHKLWFLCVYIVLCQNWTS